MEKTDLDQLKEFLNSLPSGDITNINQLQNLLFNCWNSFSGSGDTKMADYKITMAEQSMKKNENVKF